jgi:hypothetical protein
MHDSVNLEEKGVPTAVIVTTEFLHEAYMQRAALGMEEIEPVVIEHPLSTLSDEQIEGRAREAASQAKKAWLGE